MLRKQDIASQAAPKDQGRYSLEELDALGRLVDLLFLTGDAVFFQDPSHGLSIAFCRIFQSRLIYLAQLIQLLFLLRSRIGRPDLILHRRIARQIDDRGLHFDEVAVCRGSF